MKFQKGQSGNPAGRPKGSPDKRTALRGLFEGKAEDLVNAVIQKALDGDVTAMRLCIDRIIPAINAESLPIVMPMVNQEGTAADQARDVLGAIANGDLNTEHGAHVVGAIGTLAKIVELDELEKRLAALEAKQGSK